MKKTEIKFMLWSLPIIILITVLFLRLAESSIAHSKEYQKEQRQYRKALIHYLYEQ